MADAGLGVKGDIFYPSYCGGYSMMRAGGDGLDMDARVAIHMVGSPAGNLVVVLTPCLGHVGNRTGEAGGSGVLSILSVAALRSRSGDLTALC